MRTKRKIKWKAEWKSELHRNDIGKFGRLGKKMETSMTENQAENEVEAKRGDTEEWKGH